MSLLIGINSENIKINLSQGRFFFDIIFSNEISVYENHSVYITLNELYDTSSKYSIHFDANSSQHILSVSVSSNYYSDASKNILKIYLSDENNNIKEKKTIIVESNSVQQVSYNSYSDRIQQVVNSISYIGNDLFNHEAYVTDANNFYVSNGIKEFTFDSDISNVLSNVLLSGIDFIRSQIEDESLISIYENIYRNNVLFYSGSNDQLQIIQYPQNSNSFLKNMLEIKQQIPQQLVFTLRNNEIRHSKTFQIVEYLASSLSIEHSEIVQNNMQELSYTNNNTSLVLYEKNNNLRIKLLIDNSANLYLNTANIYFFVEEFIEQIIPLNGSFTSIEDDYTQDVDLHSNYLSIFEEGQELYFYDLSQTNIYSPSYFSEIRAVLNDPVKRNKLKFRIELVNDLDQSFYVVSSPTINANYNTSSQLLIKNNLTSYVEIQNDNSFVIDIISLISSGMSNKLGYAEEAVISSDEISIRNNIEMLNNSFLKVELVIDNFTNYKILRVKDLKSNIEENLLRYELPDDIGIVSNLSIIALDKYEDDFESICNSIYNSITGISFQDTTYLADKITRTDELDSHDYFSLAFDIINL